MTSTRLSRWRGGRLRVATGCGDDAEQPGEPSSSPEPMEEARKEYEEAGEDRSRAGTEESRDLAPRG
jgi:hypothetical protein